MAHNEIKTRTVYCLTKKVPDENYDVYIGSTSSKLEFRFSCHKSEAKTKRFPNRKLYNRMREVGLNNWKITPLQTMECTKDEIRTYERNWCDLLEANLNLRKPFLTDADGVADRMNKMEYNRQKIKEIYRRNLDSKRYYSEVCDASFGIKYNFEKHKDTLKHQYTFLNSLD